MNKKKILIFSAIAIFIIALIGLLIYSFRTSYDQHQTVKQSIPELDTQKNVDDSKTPELEKADKVSISGFDGSVLVNNFFNKTVINHYKYGKIIVLAESSGYITFYAFEGNFFRIVVLESPYKMNRQKAEESLFRALGITRKESCQLPSEVQVLAYNDPDSDKVADFRISGCPDAIELDN